MIRADRSLFKYIIFTILTCGIYSYVFIYQLAQDMNIICDGDGEETAGLFQLVLFSILTCGIYSWIWYYKLGNRMANNGPKYGLHIQENGTTILLWFIFGSLIFGVGAFVAIYFLIRNINDLATAYNEQH